uniref:equilibrative nucleobase transporter 1-like n=1 Tax=Pristiophorus japonicus TaxID=55135 RepID=UPI00398E5387
MAPLNKKVKRYLTFATGLFECISFTGVIFGWASLVFVLKKEEYFSDLCVPLHNSSDPGVRNGTMDCDRQDERFTLIFTLASCTISFVAFPSGLLFDHFGTMVTHILAIFLHTTATLIIAFSTAASAALLFPALCLMAVGGRCFFMTNFQVGNLFGNKRSTVITLYNGTFNTSSGVFLLVKVLYEAGFSLRPMFLFISCLSCLHILRTCLLLPRTHIPYPLPEEYSYGMICAKFELKTFSCVEGTESQRKPYGGMDGDRSETREETEGVRGERREETEGDRGERREETEGDRGERREETEVTLCFSSPPTTNSEAEGNEEEIPSFRSCIFSKLFLTHMLWLSIMQLRLNLFIGTLNPMLSLLASGDSRQVSRFTNAFAFTLLCGILCAPWNGLIMDRHKGRAQPSDNVSAVNTQSIPVSDSTVSQRLADMKSAVLSLTITVTQSILFSISAAIPVLKVQYLTFILQLVNSSFLYGSHTAFTAITFPPRHFGKVYGLLLALAAIVNLLQYPCFILVKGPLHGDPLYLNIGLIVLVTLTYVHPINVYLHCRRETQQRGTVKHYRVEVPGLGETDDQPVSGNDI